MSSVMYCCCFQNIMAFVRAHSGCLIELNDRQKNRQTDRQTNCQSSSKSLLLITAKKQKKRQKKIP